MKPYLDACICVPHQETLSSNLVELGWSILESNPVPKSYCEGYQTQFLTETIFVSPHQPSGRIILLTCAEPATPMQSKIDPYEYGGWFDLDIRTKDNYALHSIVTSQFAWKTNCPPQEWVFGPFRVVEFLSCNDFGLTVAAMQRVDPPLPNPPPGHYGDFFNSSFLVPDVKPAIDFFQSVLQCQVVLHEHITLANHPLRNVLGITRDEDAVLELVLLKGRGGYMVEPIALHHSKLPKINYTRKSNTSPPYLGLYAIRIYEENISEIEKLASQHSYINQIKKIENGLLLFTADDAWLEIYDSSVFNSVSS